MIETVKSASLPPRAIVVSGRELVPMARVATSPAKRFMDVSIALAALIFLLPALLFVALLIKIDTPGPVFFRQRRTGLNGRVFHIFKFRSMTVTEDGDRIVQAKANDKRVTSIGRILRRTSIDEIPQLINVVLGDMSLVGPRPHAMSHDQEFSTQVANYNGRFHARPGLTGLAQVNGYRGEIFTRNDLEKRIAYDLEYISTWSLALDIVTIFRTVPCLFGHKNAY